MTTEEWRDVPGWEERYEVSSWGLVRAKAYLKHSRNAHGPYAYMTKSKPIKLTLNVESGYVQFDMQRDGERSLGLVHRLVAKAFIPNPNDKPEVNHKDGDKTNNVQTNLEWATTQENILHAHRLGLSSNVGSKHPRAKLDEAAAVEIRRLYEAGVSTITLAEMFGVKRTTIYTVTSRRKWKHV